MSRRPSRTLPPVLDTWPAWAAPAALGALWAGGLVAAVVVLATLSGTHPAAVKLAAALIADATTVALLIWLARGTGECSAARFGIAPAAPRRAVAGAVLVALPVAGVSGLLALLGLFDGVDPPPELWRVDRLAAPLGVPLDAAGLASLLARAVLAPVLLEVVVRGVLLPALARLVGPWPAIGVSAVAGAAAWGGLAGDERLLLPALLLGVLLGPLFVATGSIVPGTGVASALAGAAVALQCGWGAPAALLTGGAAAALAVASLLALAVRAPAAEPAPVPRPRGGFLAGERGQTAAETMGVLLIVAAIIAALFASGLGADIARQTQLLICRIAGGDCRTYETAVDPDCMVSRTINTGGMAVTVAVVKVGEENTLIKQVYADGRTVFTLIENGSVAAELIAGAKARAGNVGFDATASVSAGGQLDGARTYTFTDPKKAAEFEAMVREHGSFGQVLRNAAEGWDPLGVKDWTLDHIFGDDVDMEDLPEPDSTYLNVDAFITGEAAAIGNVILADAGASALLKYSGGARLYTSGPQEGTVELNMKLDGELAGQLGLVTFGPNIQGKANFTVRVTLDPKNGYRPSHMRVIATAGYNGDLTDSDFRLNPTTGQLEQIQEALKKGKLLDSGSLATTDGTGSQIEFTADLDLKDDTARAEAIAILTGSLPAAVAAGDLARRVDDQGRLTFQSYDTSASNTEGGLVVGLGVGGGVEGSQSSESRDLGGAWVREPGGTWQVRNCGPR